jgi:hypothetical protein
MRNRGRVSVLYRCSDGDNDNVLIALLMALSAALGGIASVIFGRSMPHVAVLLAVGIVGWLLLFAYLTQAECAPNEECEKALGWFLGLFALAGWAVGVFGGGAVRRGLGNRGPRGDS